MTREMLNLRARQLYLELHDIEQALAIVSENQSLLDTFIRISEARYRTGSGIQQDILKARLEHARLTERLIRLEARQAGLRSTMNILRGNPADSRFDLAGLPEPAGPLPGADELLEMARTGNPTLLRGLRMPSGTEAGPT